MPLRCHVQRTVSRIIVQQTLIQTVIIVLISPRLITWVTILIIHKAKAIKRKKVAVVKVSETVKVKSNSSGKKKKKKRRYDNKYHPSCSWKQTHHRIIISSSNSNTFTHHKSVTIAAIVSMQLVLRIVVVLVATSIM